MPILLNSCHNLFPILTAVLFHIPVFCPHFHSSPFPFPFFAWTPVVWRCNSLPLCVVRITTMARPLLPLHLPPRSPKPSFPAWTLMVWYAAPAITKPQWKTQLTATAPQRKTGPWPAGVTAVWPRTACSSNVTTAGEMSYCAVLIISARHQAAPTLPFLDKWVWNKIQIQVIDSYKPSCTWCVSSYLGPTLTSQTSMVKKCQSYLSMKRGNK